MPKYANPADKLSVIASEPRKLLNKNVTITEIADLVRVQQLKNIEVTTIEEDRLNEELLSLFTEVAERKKVNFCKEFYLVFHRMYYHVFRNPVNITYVIFLGVFNSLLWLSVYKNVDEPSLRVLTP
jgi:hypothetical protein